MTRTPRIESLDLRTSEKKEAGADLDEFGVAFEFPTFPAHLAERIDRRVGERRRPDPPTTKEKTE